MSATWACTIGWLTLLLAALLYSLCPVTMTTSQPLVWLITGTSTGLGRALTLEALSRGDKVIATARARSFGQLADLEAAGANTLQLDVTTSPDEMNEFAKQAVAIHGRVDVVVNNAGEDPINTPEFDRPLTMSYFMEAYTLIGAFEEHTPEEQSSILNTNLIGGLNVTRALLPYMRARKTGTVVWIGSVSSWIPLPSISMYSLTKFAMRSKSFHCLTALQS
jgi:NAD(P)-dependent dehydrogenase (short-subunit alcohol dehydrogenase family)